MQLNINITKKNKEKVFKLIDAILEEEAEETEDYIEKQIIEINNKDKSTTSKINYLEIPKDIPNLKNAKVIVYSKENDPDNLRINSVGTWGQFNSFFPIKASLRILANSMISKNLNSIRLDNFVNECLEQFRKKGYNVLRGFPSTNKDTAKGRFVWHFLTNAYEMGLITITESRLDYEGMPNTLLDWDQVFISITREGLDFAILPNNIFDELNNQQILTNDEKNWLVTFLKNIDAEGYKEFSLLLDVYNFLKEGHNGKDELWNWFRENDTFVNYIKSWSRKAQRDDLEGFSNQINNLSITFAGSKIALLRELGVIKNRRNNYSIVGEFD